MAVLASPFTTVWSKDSELCNPRIQSPNSQIKLSSNENPYGPSSNAKQAIIDSLAVGNRYPGNIKNELANAIAKNEALSSDQVLLSAGSTEILHILGSWLASKPGRFISTEKTFPVLMMCGEALGSTWERLPLDKNLRVDLNRLTDSIKDDTKAIYLCNPNNPTGTALPSNDLVNFCKQLNDDQLLLIDEAYIEYTSGGLKNSMASLIHNHPNILVIRTFSKIYGLAGIRIGYALGNGDLLTKIKNHRVTAQSCCSTTGLAAGLASLADQSFVQSSYQKNATTRKFFTDHLDNWGVTYADSETNFVYYPIDVFELRGKSFRDEMRKNQILCPPFDHEKISYSRTTIGTHEEMTQLVSILSNMI